MTRSIKETENVIIAAAFIQAAVILAIAIMNQDKSLTFEQQEEALNNIKICIKESAGPVTSVFLINYSAEDYPKWLGLGTSG